MNNQVRRKLAAFLAAVMFATSVPFPAVAEDLTEPETAEATVEVQPEPAAEQIPAAESVESPAEEPEAEPVQEAGEAEAVLPEVEPAENVQGDIAPAGRASAEAAQSQAVTALAAPVVSMPDSVQAGEDIVIRWEPVENAEYYWLSVYEDDNGGYGEWLDGKRADSMTGATLDVVLEPGSYRMDVYAHAEGYESSYTTVTFTVTGELSAPPVLTLDAEKYMFDSDIIVTVVAEGAEEICLRYYGTDDSGDNHSDTVLFDAEGTTTNYKINLYTAGQFYAMCSVKVNGIWSAYCEPVPFELGYLGELENPAVTLKDSYAAGEEITVEWDAVENAEWYRVELYDADGINLCSYYPDLETSVTIDRLLTAGNYRVEVFAQADGYKMGCTTASFAVTGELAAAPGLTLDAASYVAGSKITCTVTAEGAQQVRLKISGTSDEGYHYNDTFEFAATGTTTAYARNFYTPGSFQAVCSVRIDGAWSAYSEPVSFEVKYLGELDAPVLSMKDSYAAGEDITVSWTAVEHAEGYGIRLVDEKENYIKSWWVEAEETAVLMDTVLEAGSYCVSVRVSADAWKSPEETEHPFTVTGTLMEGPSFTVDTDTVVTGKDVTFTVSMEGATAFRLLCDDDTREYAAENGAATFTRTLYGAGEVVTARISACIDGIWTAYGPAQEITVQDLPTLGITLPVLPETIRAGEDIEVTWEPVEHAERYRVDVAEPAEGNRYVQVWAAYLNAATDECRTVIPAGKLKQGKYLVSVTASASGYHTGNIRSVFMEVGAPLPGNEFDYYVNSNNEVYLEDYLGDPAAEEVVLPETIKGAKVVSISYGGFLKNNGTLKKVTIPASVTSIADDAFEGSVNLTICGYYGSDAEEYAILNGYAFEALDTAQPAVSADWEKPVLVNKEMTFAVSAPGATEVVMYEGGYKEYYSTVVLTDNGASVRWTPEKTGTYCVRFEAKVNGEWLTTKNYALEVTSGGQMPQVRNLKASANTIEPGTAVTITWDAPEGVTAPIYGVIVVDSDEDLDDYTYWDSVDPGESSHTFPSYNFEKEGTYILAVRVEADPGYEPSVATCTVEVKSTRLWDFNADRNKVIGYHGTDKEIVIPSQIDGVPVYTIGSSLFADSDITSVVIPEGVTIIEQWAFQKCTDLTDVSLPSTLRGIYTSAFADCSALSEIRLPDNLYSIYTSAFSGCEALTSVRIPDGITILERSLFSQCSALAQVTLPEGLVRIDAGAFGYCDSLRTITIPQSVTTIDKNAFQNNKDLTICGYTGSAAETFAAEQGYDFVALDSMQTGDISFTLERDTLYYGGLMKITVTAPDAEKLRLHLDGQVSECSIYNGKTEISRHIHGLGEHTVTVSQCVDGRWMAPCAAETFTVIELAKPVIESIAAVPAGTPATVRWKPVEGAEDYSLYLSLGDDSVTSYHDIVSLDKDGFVYQQLTAEDLAHEGIYAVQVTARAADSGSSYSTRAFEVTKAEEFLYEVNEDGTATLTGHTGGAREVVVPAQLDDHRVVKIGQKAFLGSNAVSITLPASVEVVEQWAFYGCEDLETLRISDAQATICQYAFEGCTKLTAIYAGAGIFAEDRAFDNCRTDTVVYGYSGGQLEEAAKSSCKFSALGTLAEGPAIAAENIWQNEDLNYSVSCGDASMLYIQEIYPDGNVVRYTRGSGQIEETADSYDFEELEENVVVRIRAAALVNGAWTAYAEKEVAVSVLGALKAPVFKEIGRLERHLDHQIRWYPVEDAQSYEVSLYKDKICLKTVTMDASRMELAVSAGTLTEDVYTVEVTAMAEGFEPSSATAEFEVYAMKLEAPEITADKRIARHLGAEIRWSEVPVAEQYAVTVQREEENGTVTLYHEKKVKDLSFELLPSEMKPGRYTVSVTAHALYCTPSDPAEAEFEVYEQQLDAPEVTAPVTVVGGIDFDISWKSVENAEMYHVEIMDGSDKRIYNVSLGSQTVSHTMRLGEYLPEDTLTLRVIASADYRVNGVAEWTMTYKPLYSYEVVDGNAVITGYNGPDTVLDIPMRINGYEVTAIGDGAFEGKDSLVEVYLPESITSIGDRSFKNCTALQYIEGDGVTEIGAEAFYNCIALRDFSFGKNNGYQVVVKENAFYEVPIQEREDDPDEKMDIEIDPIPENPGGTGGGDITLELPSYAGNLYLGRITYKEGITEIPARTHYNNILLSEVYLPRSLRTIGSEAFAECPLLDYMRVYDGIESIAEDAFSGSDSLTLYIYTSDMESISYVEQYAIDHEILYVKYYSEERSEQLYAATYPNGTYHIGERECFRDPWLETVWLPETLETIGSKAFAQCDSLMDIYLYDGITSIADDAFEGSDNVQFVIYSYDQEEEPYVEQYAKEHGIPYIKHILTLKPEDKIDTGNPAPTTVRIDEPVRITVARIPANADRVVLYSDGEEIGSMAVGGVSQKSYTHSFRTFGQQILTAEAYIGDEVVKLSWEKPVIVVGIRLTADRESAWTCEPVTFTVEAYPDVQEVNFYADGLWFGSTLPAENQGAFTYPFTQAGDRKITVRSDNGLQSKTLTLPILCIGQLEQPVLEAEELQYVGDGLVCSWNTTENTDGYVLRVRYAGGRDVLQRRIEDDDSERMTCVIPAEELGGEGTYQLYLMNYGYKYNQNESETITVELTADRTPRFTMDKQSVMTGEPVTFTFCAFGATEVELWADGEAIETIALNRGRGEFIRKFTQSGDRKMQIRALREDGWTELSEVQILKVTSKGTLGAVQVTADPVQLLGNTIKASWTAVENADGYNVYFRNTAHETIYSLSAEDCEVRVPADLVTQSGSYYFMVVAYGEGYDQNEGRADVTVADHLPGPVIVTPAEKEVCTNTAVTLTWQAVEGAESYVVSLAKKTDRLDSSGQNVYEKVWAAPNESVNVGTALRYDLTDLAYGGEYRVAVGTVSTLESGEQCIGWTERLFSVQQPELTATLTADTLTPTEGSQLILTAVANHPMTQAVLTDETGAVVETVSSTSEEVNGTRVFTFVLTAGEMGEKTYTVTVSGRDALAGILSASASLTVEWVDPDAAVIKSVAVEPVPMIVGNTGTFTIITNANTEKVEVYVKNAASVRMRGVDGGIYQETLESPSAGTDGALFFYTTSFDQAGEETWYFIPYNAKEEAGEPFTQPVTVYPKGKLPAPVITAPALNAEVSTWGCTVEWDPVVLAPGMTFGGYSVTVKQVGNSGLWEPIPGHTDVFVGTVCQYHVPGMAEGAYRVEVSTVPAGMNQPDPVISSFGFVEFWMKTPDVEIITPVNDTFFLIGNPIAVEGTAVGGITKVMVRLTPAGVDRGIPVKDANGNAAEYLVVDVVNGKFSAVVNPVNNLKATTYGIEVYGFLDGMPIQTKPYADSDWRIIKSGAELLVDGGNPNWKFEDPKMSVQVKTGIGVEEIVLYDRTDGITLPVKFTRDDNTPGVHLFTASKVSLYGEGRHELVAMDTAGNELATADMYVVIPTADTPKSCPDGETVRVWLYPVETGDYLKDVTSADTLVQQGTCGDYLLIQVNGTSLGFVHKDKLEPGDSELKLLYPTDTDTIVLSEVEKFTIRWTPKTGAKSYDVKLTTHYVNRQGKESSVEIFTKTVKATNDPEQTLPVASSEILNKVKLLSSVINTDWVTDIEITPNS